jgi:hypothetical protein
MSQHFTVELETDSIYINYAMSKEQVHAILSLDPALAIVDIRESTNDDLSHVRVNQLKTNTVH